MKLWASLWFCSSYTKLKWKRCGQEGFSDAAAAGSPVKQRSLSYHCPALVSQLSFLWLLYKTPRHSVSQRVQGIHLQFTHSLMFIADGSDAYSPEISSSFFNPTHSDCTFKLSAALWFYFGSCESDAPLTAHKHQDVRSEGTSRDKPVLTDPAIHPGLFQFEYMKNQVLSKLKVHNKSEPDAEIWDSEASLHAAATESKSDSEISLWHKKILTREVRTEISEWGGQEQVQRSGTHRDTSWDGLFKGTGSAWREVWLLLSSQSVKPDSLQALQVSTPLPHPHPSCPATPSIPRPRSVRSICFLSGSGDALKEPDRLSDSPLSADNKETEVNKMSIKLKPTEWNSDQISWLKKKSLIKWKSIMFFYSTGKAR